MRPAIALLLFATLSADPAGARVTVVVKDIDTGEGIQATVYQIKGPPPVEQNIGSTDDTGTMINARATCRVGDTITIKLISADYSEPDRATSCSGEKVTVLLRRDSAIEKIAYLAKRLETSGNHAVAAQAFTELNASQPSKANEARVYSNLSLALGLQPKDGLAYDPLQKKKVPNPALVLRIKDLQRSNGINDTGLADEKTLAILARGTVRANVLDRAEVR